MCALSSKDLSLISAVPGECLSARYVRALLMYERCVVKVLEWSGEAAPRRAPAADTRAQSPAAPRRAQSLPLTTIVL